MSCQFFSELLCTARLALCDVVLNEPAVIQKFLPDKVFDDFGRDRAKLGLQLSA